MRATCITGVALLAVMATMAAGGQEGEGGSQPAAPDRPNVILIITDDQGYGDLGVTGNPVIRTPNIDALARGSATVERFYVSPVCAPTRACLMTGRYNYRTRCIDTYVGRAMLEPDEVTVAERLRDAGYATGIFGKWHLGDCHPMQPNDQGFEMSLVHRGGGIGQPSDPPGGEGRYTDAVLFRNGERVETEGYCTDVYFDAAMSWIERSHRAGRPFFAYLATNAPHGPFHDVPQELHERYRAEDLSNHRFPQDAGHPLPDAADTDRRARIFAMITNIDENVGRLLRRLDELDLTGNTLIIFMVDNGPNGRRYVAGMRGSKGSVYEGGIRSPFFARWPGRLPAGGRTDRIAAHIDVMPTLLEACGVDPPPGLDGRSLLPLLEGERPAWPDRTIVIQSHRGDVPVLYHHFAARSQRWKLVNASGFGRETLPGPPAFELYDMEADPLEMTDVAADHPEIVSAMKAAYERWFRDVGSTRPDNYDPPRIHVGTPPETVTTLTRQDWRHTHGGVWGPESIGRWLIRIARSGRYRVDCRFEAAASEGEAVLVVGNERWVVPVETGAVSCRFRDLDLVEGEADLAVTVTDEAGARGAHQVDVAAP